MSDDETSAVPGFAWPEPRRVALPARAGGDPSFEIVFLGDSYLGDSYEARRVRRGLAPHFAGRDASSFLDGVRHLVAGADFAIANLEAPITSLASSPLEGRKKYLHRADAESTVAALRELGVRACSLANNHSGDYGARGLGDTIAALSGVGIASLGADPTAAEAARPLVLEMAGARRTLRVAILAAYDVRPTVTEFYADAVAPAVVHRVEQDGLAAQVEALRRRDPDLRIVAFLHWGANYAAKTTRQRRLARRLAAAGADLVIGHGAHVVQDVERVGGALVAYSLGNFIFNSPGRFALGGSEATGLVLRLVVRPDSKTPLRVRLHPILTDNRKTGYRVRPLELAALGPFAQRHMRRLLTDLRVRAGDRSLEISLAAPSAPVRAKAA